MREARILQQNKFAGILRELEARSSYEFVYEQDYVGPPVSWTMPLGVRVHRFDKFPPFFEGLLPEGSQLEALLRSAKLDRSDLFGQILQVGKDLVGSVTVRPL